MICVLLAVIVLGGCARVSGPERTIELWAMGQEGDAAARLVADFERANPTLRVRVQQIPWSAAHEKLLTAFVGGTMPDVFQLGNTWVPELTALGALEPIDDRVAASAIDTADYFEGILDANVVGGRLRALPWYVDTRLLYYRSDLLAAAGYDVPPRSWDQWVTSMQRVRERGGPGAYAILLPMTEWEPPVIFALQAGARLLRDGGRFGNFRSRPFRTGFELYVSLFREALAPTAGAAQVANLYQDFAAGYFSFYISGPWNLAEFRRRLPPALDDAWATAPMPSPHGGEPGVSLAGGASLAVAASAADKEAAWRLLAHLSETGQQLALYHATGDLPARKSAWTAGGLADEDRTRAFWLQLAHVRSTPKVPEWERIAAKIARHAEAAVRGSVTVGEALAALDADADRILEKRRWMLARHPEAAP